MSPNAKLVSPFAVVVDSREQKPYTFEHIPYRKKLKDGQPNIIAVPIVKQILATGDYSIAVKEVDGNGQTRWSSPLPITIERKSLADFYSSAGRRANFLGRLQRMQDEFNFACIMVEAELSEVLWKPPKFSKLPPKTVFRTVLAWQQRFPKIHWWFVPGREFAEAATYRILERFHIEHERNRTK